MKRIFALTVGLLLVGLSFALAEDGDSVAVFPHPLMAPHGMVCTSTFFDSAGLTWRAGQEVTTSADTLQATTPRRKSPKKALLFSAVLPGAGELYAGSHLKSATFFAVEVAAWVGYVSFHNKGKDLEEQFVTFADTHWRESEYWDAIARQSGRDRNDLAALKEFEKENFSHSLHETKNQQYYEMIGKYDQFNVGWDDTETHKARDSARRIKYEDIRHDSNVNFKRATIGTTVVLFNHVVSAMDAVWTVNRYNKRLATASLRMQGLSYNGEQCPALTLTVKW